MGMSARKAKRRVLAMMANTVVLQFRWVAGDPESARIMRWLGVNTGRVVNLLRRAVREHERNEATGLPSRDPLA